LTDNIGTIYIYIYIYIYISTFYKIFEIHVKYHYKHNGNRKERNQAKKQMGECIAHTCYTTSSLLCPFGKRVADEWELND
jgi:hypothetical protein